LWQDGRFRLCQIAQLFRVDYSAVSQARRRCETRLQTDRKLRSALQAIHE
jgi:hypothetical protein